MRRDSRLSGVLHVLLHMAEHQDPVTSGFLAERMRTNAVVVRRIMAGLRNQGYVQSRKGHGGGWVLARDLSQITLRGIYDALGRPSLFAIGNRDDAPRCLVEQTVNAALGNALADAETLLLDRFNDITLAMLSAGFHTRFAAPVPGPRRSTRHGG